MEGRKLSGQRMATLEPVLVNLCHSNRLDRFVLRGQPKVNTQWLLYGLVDSIENLVSNKYAQ